MSRDCRRILLSDWYWRIFPTRLSSERQAVAEFETTAQGCRLATSVGGVLTGRGADMIIIDDPLKPEEALSQTQRRAANEWFDHTLYSRLNDKQQGAIVLIMHRLHEDDLVGHVLAQEDWEVVRFPAIAEDDETQTVDTVWGPKLLTRHQGEALHPAREPVAMLEHLRHMIGEYNFAGQYQQAPTPLGGGLVKAAWFKHYGASELPQRVDRIVQSWDTASKATELSDFSVCTTWGILVKDLYLVDLLRRRMEYPELKRAVRAQYERFRPSVVLIEDKASGTQLIQELIHEGRYAVTRYQPQTDKVMRMHAQTAKIENGFVHVPDTAPWLAPYLRELTVFPHGKHDDQVPPDTSFRGRQPYDNATAESFVETHKQEEVNGRDDRNVAAASVHRSLPRGGIQPATPAFRPRLSTPRRLQSQLCRPCAWFSRRRPTRSHQCHDRQPVTGASQGEQGIFGRNKELNRRIRVISGEIRGRTFSALPDRTFAPADRRTQHPCRWSPTTGEFTRMTGNWTPQSPPLSSDHCEPHRHNSPRSSFAIAANTSYALKPWSGIICSESIKTASIVCYVNT